MTKEEYDYLQEWFTEKLNRKFSVYTTSKYREGYREGLLKAKSILHAFYEQNKEE